MHRRCHQTPLLEAASDVEDKAITLRRAMLQGTLLPHPPQLEAASDAEDKAITLHCAMLRGTLKDHICHQAEDAVAIILKGTVINRYASKM